MDRERFYEKRASSDLDRYPEKDPVTVRLILDLLSAYDLTERYLSRAFAPHGLSPSAFNVLMVLNQFPNGCPMFTLSDLLLVSRANITGLVDSLEQRGLVGRIASTADRRSKFAQITGEGKAFLEEILPEHYRNLNHVLLDLSPQEKADLSRLLAKLRASVQKHTPENVE